MSKCLFSGVGTSKFIWFLAGLGFWIHSNTCLPISSLSSPKLKAVNTTVQLIAQGKNHQSANGGQYVPIGEARIILPKFDNNGTMLDEVRNELEERIIKSFGGFSHFEGLGGWQSNDTGILHHEPVWIYDVALSNSLVNHGNLLTIASWLRDKAKQETVYLRFPNGVVSFV